MNKNNKNGFMKRIRKSSGLMNVSLNPEVKR